MQKQLQAAKSSARVFVHPTAGHGGFLTDFAFQDQMIGELRLLLTDSGEQHPVTEACS